MADAHATIAGTVAVLNVPDGAMVANGESILDIECMKTFFTVYAPAAGIVRFSVAVGEIVGQDQVVATIEAAP